jgi:NAD(P)-dependent dehydrogenase (short-subunit alcohol dehydrogenase family)/acyl carrier protein
MMESAPVHHRVIDVASPAPQVAPVVAPAPVAPAKPVVTDPMQLVISIVSERTGYPIETLGIDLDLEADLSIDSIKRIEIIGELAQRLGLRVENGAGDADAIVEELATRKTLRALVAWLTDRLGNGTVTPAKPVPSSEVEEMVTTAVQSEPVAIGRYKLAHVETPAPINGHSTFEGKRFAIFDGGAVGDALAAKLEAERATVRRFGVGEHVGEVDGFIDLGVVDGVTSMREMFERVREAAIGGAKWIYVATIGGRINGVGGPAGLMKTVAAEWPGIKARVVDLDPSADAATILHAELHANDHHVEIDYVDGVRSSLEVVPAELSALGDAGLDSNSVVLVTGGARGITAKVAIAIARRYGCKIELVGRSLLPKREDPALANAADARALRSLLAARVTTPAEIEQQCVRALADREIRATLAALGDRATYHAVDVRTPAFGELIDQLYAKHGRIDAVIHGAGILEDKLMRHKTVESFERVFGTKLSAARILVEKLRDDVKLVVMFSSISGAFGNRGQADYAAAGDALDKLAWALQRKIAGRVISIDWGPWGGAGMVSPELEREYARRGIGLIDPDLGVAALLAELRGARGDAQVILTASDPRALLRRTEPEPAPELERVS